MRLACSVVGVFLLVAGCASDREAADELAIHATALAAATPTDKFEVETLASCVEAYSPAAVSGRGFAFDGTVARIGDGTTDRPGRGSLNYAGVTFAVNHWYVGGSGASVTVDMAPPDSGTRLVEAGPTYEAGTRLLVSGESRWGGEDLEDALAWGCGFTRYYEAETAEDWREATS
jgi:outer membrane murein-binding lipoprotein Lpp